MLRASLRDDMIRTSLRDDIIKSWNPKPAWYRFGDTWESIEVPEGYEKPPKEEFEAKLQELLDAQPWKELREERNTRIAQTDYLATIDYPHPTEEAKQAWLDYRQTLRDLPTLVTPLEGGSMKVWVTDEGGPLQPGDGLVASNVVGYFTKGEPAVVTIYDCCEFTNSMTETYYSNIVSVTHCNVLTTSETTQEGYTENAYWTSNTISHYVGNAVSYYTNVVVYDGVSVYTNVQVGEYANLATDAQEGYTPVMVSNTSPVEIEGYEPVIVYSNVSSDVYDANVHTEYTKVVTHYSNISVVEEVTYSNITDAEYTNLSTEYVVTPGYTNFYNEASNTSIRVEQYAALTPEQRAAYVVQTIAPVTSNLQSHYTQQTRTVPLEVRELEGGIRAMHVQCDHVLA
jgi:hypothetical protein